MNECLTTPQHKNKWAIGCQTRKCYAEYTLVCLQTCKIYLCGTKCDLIEADPDQRNVDEQAAKALADGMYLTNHALFFPRAINN